MVAGALGQGHAAALLVQEGVVRAAAAVHRRKALETVAVGLREGAAGLLAGGQVVQENLRAGAGAHILVCRGPWGGVRGRRSQTPSSHPQGGQGTRECTLGPTSTLHHSSRPAPGSAPAM